jgi:prophage DNA circulation protein
MSWRDNLVRASYKGIEFQVQDSNYEFGRRGVVHDFPFSDDPVEFEDLGATESTYNVTGFVVQNIYNNFDYFRTRDRLLTALQSPTPGILSHPFFGTKYVRPLGQVSFREAYTPGGIVRFSISFLEVRRRPRAVPARADDLGIIDSVFSAAGDAADSDFIDNVTDLLTTAPDYIKDFAIDDVSTLSDSVFSALKNVRGFKSESITTALNAVKAVKSTAYLVLSTPASFAENIRGLCGEFAHAIDIDSLSQAYLGTQRIPETIGTGINNILTKMQEWGRPVTPATPVNRYGGNLTVFPRETDYDKQRYTNRVNIIRLTRYHLLLEQMRICSRMQFDSINAAADIRYNIDFLVEKFVDFLGANPEYEYNYQAEQLKDAQRAFSALIEERISTLSVLDTKVVGPGGDNLLTLTYDIYGDGKDRLEDIFARNRHLTRNPAFFPPGARIEFAK